MNQLNINQLANEIATYLRYYHEYDFSDMMYEYDNNIDILVKSIENDIINNKQDVIDVLNNDKEEMIQNDKLEYYQAISDLIGRIENL